MKTTDLEMELMKRLDAVYGRLKQEYPEAQVVLSSAMYEANEIGAEMIRRAVREAQGQGGWR